MKVTSLKPFLFTSFIMISGLLLILAVFKDILTFKVLSENKDILVSWVDQRLVFSALLFLLFYIAVVAFSAPFATTLTVSGGFLFGPILGSFLSVISASIGAILLFLLIKSKLGYYFELKIKGNKSLDFIRAGIEKNLWSYLLIIRLVPVIPFWIANIAPALLGVRGVIYGITTVVGILPATIFYSYIGSTIHESFSGSSPDLSVYSKLEFVIPVSGLILLAIIPLFMRRE